MYGVSKVENVLISHRSSQYSILLFHHDLVSYFRCSGLREERGSEEMRGIVGDSIAGCHDL